MTDKSFWQSGHRPTLIMAFLYFDVAFMVWNLLGPLAPIYSKALALSPAQKGFIVAVPTLAGAVLRLVNGFLVDRIGQKVTGTIGQIIVIAGLIAAWHFGVASMNGLIAVGIILGFAGASFAVALPLASRWYPPQHQGKAMGIAGMGNSGTVLAAIFAPLLAKAFGWENVLGLAAFGGFVGLSGSLPSWYTGELGFTPVQAGYATAACVFAGSLVRPMGGALADRIGGIKTLSGVYALAAVLLVVISQSPASFAVMFPLFFLTMATLGVGNGAVFQLVPQRFRHEIGVMTGLVGFGGGVGGFYLASSLGLAKQWTGSMSSGFLIFAALSVVALAGLTGVKKRWRTTWGAAISGVRI